MHIITLGVENMERSLKFYEKGLGWVRSKMSQGDIVFFKLGGIILSLYPKDKLAEDALVSPKGSGFSGITISHNTKSEEEVDEILKKVAALGAEIIKPGQPVFWGGYSGYFRDPDGYLFEVAHNPFLEFDEYDNLKM